MDLQDDEFVSLLSQNALCSLAFLAKRVPAGSFVEVGVYQGGSAALLYQIAVEEGRALHLFDTFCGMPISGPHDKHQIGDFADCDLPKLRRMLPAAQFHVGVFPETMPAEMENLAFVHVDCDQYQSILDCIDRLMPLMVEGGIMLFDDYGELQSANDALAERFTHCGHTPEGKSFIVKGYHHGG